MSYLKLIVDAVGGQKFDFEPFRGKKVLMIGGYSLRCKLEEDGNRTIYFADWFKEHLMAAKAKSCKKFGTPSQQNSEKIDVDYCGEIEDMPEVMSNAGKFDAVVVFEGLEKVSNPGKALSAVDAMCKNGGQIMLFCRTPAELGTKVRLDYYEDNWRYVPDDITNFFPKAKDFALDNLSTPEVFLCKLIKPYKQTAPHEDAEFFHCRVGRKSTYAESLSFNFFRDFSELKKIAEKEFTDKLEHSYLDKYEFFLRDLKDKKFNLLELGVFDGGSLRMWKNYFPNAEIYGVDIDERCKAYEEDRIHIEIKDLSSIPNLMELWKIKPTIIIDDASHIWTHQLKSLLALFPVLPSGGIFIMEDLETSLNMDLFAGFNDATVSGYDACERVARIVCGKREDVRNDPLSIELTKIGMATELVATMKGSCIFIKR